MDVYFIHVFTDHRLIRGEYLWLYYLITSIVLEDNEALTGFTVKDWLELQKIRELVAMSVEDYRMLE